MSNPAVDPKNCPRIRLWDKDWNVVADTTLDGRSSVYEWIRTNASVGDVASIDNFWHRRFGTVQPDGTLRNYEEELRGIVQWPRNPF